MEIDEKLKNLVPGWLFGIEEVSNNHFVFSGRDQFGHTVSCEGTDEFKLIESGRDQAVWVSLQDKDRRSRFLYEYLLHRFGKQKITRFIYDEKVFGSWYIDLLDRRIIFDGKDSLLIVQGYNDEWKDLWVKPIESVSVELIKEFINA